MLPVRSDAPCWGGLVRATPWISQAFLPILCGTTLARASNYRQTWQGASPLESSRSVFSLSRWIPAHYRWARTGDVNAFFGLMLDNTSDLVIMAGLLVGVFGMPGDLVLGRMIPGTAIGVFVGDMAYTWMAWRLAARTKRDDVCAMPLGLDTPSTFVFCLGIIGPIYLDGVGKGLDPHSAGLVAWQAGMAILVFTGLVKIGLSFVGEHVRRWVPRAGLLGSIAGVAIVLIAFLPATEVFASPVAGFLSLGIILAAIVGGRALPFRLPGAFVAVTIGALAYYALVAAGVQDGRSWSQIVEAASLRIAWPTPTLAFVDGISHSLIYLPVALPWAVVTVVGGIDCTESAAAAGDEYDTRDVLLVEGFATTIGGFCGGVIQSTPYIGHPAYKRMGGRAAYTLATALFIGLGGVFGYLGFLVDLIPKAATAPILIFIGLEITAQAFTATPNRHAPAVALAFVPVIANLVLIELGQFLPGPGQVPDGLADNYRTLVVMAIGVIFTAMIWGGGAAYLTDRRYAAAALTFLVGAACSLVGVMHSPFDSGQVFWPWSIGAEHVRIVFSIAGAYALMAAVIWAMHWLPAEGETPQTPLGCSGP